MTITGTVANDKLYDGNTLATLFNIGTVSTGVGIETLTLTDPLAANINFNDPNVLIADTVTASGYSLAEWHRPGEQLRTDLDLHHRGGEHHAPGP